MCLDLQRYEMDSHHFLVLVLLFMLQFNISLLFQMCGQCRPEQCPLHIIREGCGRGREIELDECSCCPRCTRSESESCGGMKQLSCSPGLYCAYRPGRTFGYIREGVCEPYSCARKVCSFRQHCQSSIHGLVCSCPQYRCEGKLNRVCGGDRVVYDSLCHLRRHECTTGRYVGVQEMSACENVKQLPLNPSGNLLPDLHGNNRGNTQGCTYKNKFYAIGQLIPSGNPCLHLECQSGAVIQARLPGCLGGPIENDIGADKPPVHGQWGPWSSWSKCNGKCSRPVETRTRYCTPHKYEGHPCTGESEETQPCVLRSCERKYCEPYAVTATISFQRERDTCMTTMPQMHRRCVSHCTKTRRGKTTKLCCRDDPTVTNSLTTEIQCTNPQGRKITQIEQINVIDGCICELCPSR
ncbi:uncharacterized protein [Dysidea avara]|uniref:uncharacterized protein n=1 Tax=Dysidea avara TaxID=196820 RepID=UPI00331E0B94